MVISKYCVLLNESRVFVIFTKNKDINANIISI